MIADEFLESINVSIIIIIAKWTNEIRNEYENVYLVRTHDLV